MSEDRTLCLLCRVGPERLALRAADVHKVVGQNRVCRLPRLPAAVSGITHHRGRIVTVFDAGALLFGNAPSHASGVEARVLVIERGQRHLAIAVDAVNEIEGIRLGPELPIGPSPAMRMAQRRGQAIFAIDADGLVAAMLQAGMAAEAPRA